MKRSLVLLVLVCAFGPLVSFVARGETTLPEPGPETGGMRLRYVVTPEKNGSNEIFRVRVDLINTTDHPIQLVGDWEGDRKTGDFKEYLEADISITTDLGGHQQADRGD